MLFAWLGNVRNGFGFAGCPIFTPIVPLSDNRGLPEDFTVSGEDSDSHIIPSSEIRGDRAKYYTEEDSNPDDPDCLRFWMGDHSHSWLSADEILAADRPKVEREGIITIKEFKAWNGTSCPESWCGGVGGPGVMVSIPEEITEATSHVKIHWVEDTQETLAYFVDKVKRLKEEHGEVRFVFGFDS